VASNSSAIVQTTIVIFRRHLYVYKIINKHNSKTKLPSVVCRLVVEATDSVVVVCDVTVLAAVDVGVVVVIVEGVTVAVGEKVIVGFVVVLGIVC